MVIRKASLDTDQTARSLLQKAVRRWHGAIAEATFHYLAAEKNELRWLRSRLAVMTFEEAWPYGADVSFGRNEAEIAGHYVALSRSAKNKDAAGLGSLAYALSRDDKSVLDGGEGDWYIRVVSKALEAREQFWDWIRTESANCDSRSRGLIERAFEGSKKAGWPWDKAFTYAAAVLAVKQPVPLLDRANVDSADPFPFWVAIDKHTPKGKEVIRALAKERKIRPNIALWLSFYLESGGCARLVESPWWEREKRWRFTKLGLMRDEAEGLWALLRSALAERLNDEAERLAHLIERYRVQAPTDDGARLAQDRVQGSLFG